MHNVFDIKRSIENFGVWYALHHYGFSRTWSIWVATRMIKRERLAVGEHAEWHYNR